METKIDQFILDSMGRSQSWSIGTRSSIERWIEDQGSPRAKLAVSSPQSFVDDFLSRRFFEAENMPFERGDKPGMVTLESGIVESLSEVQRSSLEEIAKCPIDEDFVKGLLKRKMQAGAS